jgi:pimeloyl-ACP methyl ester carboxylesterase
MSGYALARRRFFTTAALALAGAQLNATRPSKALAQRGAAASAHTSFESLKQVNAGELNVGYAEAGPANGAVVILLHGWPYDIHSYVDVAPLLARVGFRVIVPHLRGHGTTRFLANNSVRSGQQSVVALDTIALMDALKITKAIIAGYDWGARTAAIIAAVWPERCTAVVCANGYLINNLERNQRPLPPRSEQAWWYQYYFATERGRAGLEANRRELAKLIWQTNSPKWHFDDATFARSAEAFDNPDYVDIVVHNYRWRLSLAPGELRFDALERRLATGPVIQVPALTIEGDSDGIAPATDGSAYAAKFAGKWSHRIVQGAGHNLPQEAPREFAEAIVAAAQL